MATPLSARVTAPRDRLGVLLLAMGSAAACTPPLPSVELPSEDAKGLLSDAVLLPLTTRSTAGLLGQVWSGKSRRVETSRRVLAGTPRHDETRQHVEVLRRVELLASLGASVAGLGVEAGGRARTDVAYSVDITGYETLEPPAGGYAQESGCCVDGRVAEACEGGFVGRVLRGSGKIRYLRRLDAEASANLGPVLHARGGGRYELVDETSFEDAFFAFVPEPLASVCSGLSPEQEIAPIRVVASDNCTVRVYSSNGKPSTLAQSTYYPNSEACWSAAAHTCQSQPDALAACPATYRETDGSLVVRDFAAPATAGPPPAPGPGAAGGAAGK